jgi:hypothetical protein
MMTRHRTQRSLPATPAKLETDLERVAHALDETVRRTGDATLADYEQRRQRQIDDVAGQLPDDSPEPR